MKTQLTIGTRGSALALWQAEHVKKELAQRFPFLEIKFSLIKTKGDKIRDVPLAKIGGKGLFVKEIEDALLREEIDLAVHSMKDVPTELPPGLQITAITAREDARDVLISKNGLKLVQLPQNGKVGTSSLRRKAQLLHWRADLDIAAIRGNLDTRLRKLRETDLDAIVVAAAGIKRLVGEAAITEYLSLDVMLPAAGQGALGIETRQGDAEVNPLVETLNGADSEIAVLAERALLRRLSGGCQIPIGTYAQVEPHQLTLIGVVVSLDGKQRVFSKITGSPTEYEALGRQLASELLECGAQKILEGIREA